MITRILAWLGYRRSTPTLRCYCGARADVYDETRGYCGKCYLRHIGQ
jgi:hypothetical protein